MPVRYFMIAGFAVLALLYYDKLDLLVAGKIDFEQILPSAINQFVPVGLTGLLLAGLLAAFMSTFAGTLNAAQAYIVNDIYLKYVNPKASNRKISSTNYITGIFVVLLSIVFGVFALDVNSILQWIVSALYGSYVASNVLKWYWWRFNGSGFFWGMLAGIIPALLIPVILNLLEIEILDLYYFPVILVTSIAGCIIGTLSTKPTDERVLIEFYKNVKPWGFWKPIREKILKKDPGFIHNKNFKRDMFNVFIGIIAQTGLVILPIYVVLMNKNSIIISALVVVVSIIILKKTWWDKLPEE
jgi:Na+/proline symporter